MIETYHLDKFDISFDISRFLWSTSNNSLKSEVEYPKFQQSAMLEIGEKEETLSHFLILILLKGNSKVSSDDIFASLCPTSRFYNFIKFQSIYYSSLI